MNRTIRKMVRSVCNITRHKGKALNLRMGHRMQRHEDGSYTLTIRLIPEGVDMNIGGVDGIIINHHQGFRVLNG